MERAVEVKPAALKMSVCSDFVEHIWKPGSCKNCFCPRNFHPAQTPPADLGGSSGLLRDLNGIGAKAENLPLEDEGITSLPYSKPTIAVKPTMINSDVADAWADGNLSTDIPQVSKRTTFRKHILMKSGEEQRARIDKFSNSVVRKPAVQNAPNDSTSHSHPVIGPSGLESRAERNISFSNMTFLSGVGAQENGAEVPSKEKLALPYLGLCHKSSIFSDRYVAPVMDSERYPPIHQKGEASLSEKAGIANTPDLESEGGEYCSIADYSGEGPVHQGFDNTSTSVEWPENENSVSKFQGQDAVVNARAESRVVNFSEGESRVLNSEPGYQREKPLPRDYAYNRLCSEAEILAFLPDAVLKSNSPLDLCQGNDCCPLVRESEQMEGKHIQNVHHSAEQEFPSQVGLQNEPIYAESTKRKKAQLSNSNTHPRSDALACSPYKDQEGGLWRERTLHLSCEKEFQDSAMQVAATITVMAAHTDDDKRKIFLSSPDSAVGVQWPSVSPTSNSESGKTSPFFESRELPQANHEMASRENGSGLQSPIGSKYMIGETPAIPPKLSKGSPPRSEGSLTRSASSSTAETCDSPGREDVDIPRNGADCPISGPSSSLCSHVNRISVEEPNRSLSSSSSERRQKYHNLPWSRQFRIEEEEEEEHGLLKSMPETEIGNGARSPPSSSNFHQGGKGSLQENKPAGMSKSASFAFEFPKDKNGIEDFAPPPPPPKKQSRHFLKMNKSNSELEKLNSDSTENLSPALQRIHVTFTGGSTDSLNLDANAFSNGGQLCKTGLRSPTRTGKQIFPLAHFSACPGKAEPPCKPSQPPPLPQKKTVSRAVSSPDGFYCGPASPARAALPSSPKLNFSQSESNVCIREESLFGCRLGINQRTFSSSESLEKAFKGSHFPLPHSGTNGNPCCSQNKNLPPRSCSQHSMSTQVPSGSSLQLHNLLSNIDSKEGVYTKLGGLYAESLRRLVLKCEDCFMRDQKSELHFSENNWSLFKLTCNKPCCDSGDAIYYCATCSKDPSSTYAVKICKSQDTKAAASCCSPSVPIHFNIQQDCGHFVASVPSSMLKNAPTDGQCPSRAAGAEQDCVVVITREVPHQTAADFVRDAGPFHTAKPELYERRVCFLLLQLCNGLEHLKKHSVIHRDLCLENLLLIHCRPLPSSCGQTKEDKRLPRLIISNFLKAKQKPGSAESKVKKNQARLAPEIVSASQYKKFDEFQTGILIYELLHQPNPFEVKADLREQEYSQDDLPPLPNLSIYSRGLQQLAHLLLEADPIKRICILEAKRIVQCLLWGPRKDLTDQPLNHEEALHGTLHNWIDMKRALLMMKFAERAVDAERNVELEDWLCCQYLASADPSSLRKSLKLLQLL